MSKESVSDLWGPVTLKDQVRVGSKLKIVGVSRKNSYLRGITVKSLIQRGSSTEVIINEKKNYYFILDAYLDKRETWGKWVKELYVRKEAVQLKK